MLPKAVMQSCAAAVTRMILKEQVSLWAAQS